MAGLAGRRWHLASRPIRNGDTVTGTDLPSHFPGVSTRRLSCMNALLRGRRERPAGGGGERTGSEPAFASHLYCRRGGPAVQLESAAGSGSVPRNLHAPRVDAPHTERADHPEEAPHDLRLAGGG